MAITEMIDNIDYLTKEELEELIEELLEAY